jgi:hypothetical protein
MKDADVWDVNIESVLRFGHPLEMKQNEYKRAVDVDGKVGLQVTQNGNSLPDLEFREFLLKKHRFLNGEMLLVHTSFRL